MFAYLPAYLECCMFFHEFGDCKGLTACAADPNSRKLSCHGGKTAIFEMSANGKQTTKWIETFWKMRWHAGKTTFFAQHTSNITPKMFMKSVQNDPKMEPKAVPERSPRHFQRKAAKLFKSRPRGSKSRPKGSPKWHQKGHWNYKKRFGWSLFHIKKTMILWKLFFLVFCPPREVPDPENQAKTL